HQKQHDAELDAVQHLLDRVDHGCMTEWGALRIEVALRPSIGWGRELCANAASCIRRHKRRRGRRTRSSGSCARTCRHGTWRFAAGKNSRLEVVWGCL